MVEQEAVKVAADLVEVIDKAVEEHFKFFKGENAKLLEELTRANATKALQAAEGLAQAEVAKMQKLKAAAAADLDALKPKAQKAFSSFLDALDKHKLDIDVAVEEHLALLKGKAEEKLAELAGVKELATDGVIAALKGELVAESSDLDKCRVFVDVLAEKSADKEGSKQLVFRLHRLLNILEVKQLKVEPADFKDVLPALLDFNTFLKTGILPPEQMPVRKPVKVDKPSEPEVFTKEQHKQKINRSIEISRLEHDISENKKELANYNEDPHYPNRKERLQEWLKQDEAALAKLKGEQPQQKTVRQETDEDSFVIEND